MPKRTLQGTVVSDKADKTVTILVTRRFKHSAYKKYVTTTKKYTAHDQDNSCKIGDVVSITENKPISKTKKWLVVKN